MLDLHAILSHLVDLDGSDLHLGAHASPRIRVNDDLRPAPFPEVAPDEISELLDTLLPPDRLEEFRRSREADFSLVLPEIGRFRGNACCERGSAAIVLRRVLPVVMTAEALGLPSIVTDLLESQRGMVLVTGPTGSGKTTSLAAMVDHINDTRACKVVTIEDPIEIVHTNKRSVIWQREIGTDTDDYAQATRRVLRQDPDVILIGEMRDSDTVAAALHAAHTGHLVLSSLHTTNATETINRIVDFFPSFHQRQIRLTLAEVLKGVISQRLVPLADGTGRTVAIEVMVVTGRIADRIAKPDGLGETIEQQISRGDYLGMQTFDQSLLSLVTSGAVTTQGAMSAATSPHDLRVALERAGVDVRPAGKRSPRLAL